MKRFADIEKIEKLLVHGIDESGDALISVRDVKKAISQAENKDAMEVVRCKDCRYWTDGECKTCGDYCEEFSNTDELCRYCSRLGVCKLEHGYCDYGERREEE